MSKDSRFSSEQLILDLERLQSMGAHQFSDEEEDSFTESSGSLQSLEEDEEPKIGIRNLESYSNNSLRSGSKASPLPQARRHTI